MPAVDLPGEDDGSQTGGDGGDEVAMVGLQQEKLGETDENHQQGAGARTDKGGEGKRGEGGRKKIGPGAEGVVRGEAEEEQDEGEVTEEGEEKEAEEAVADKGFGQDQRENEG